MFGRLKRSTLPPVPIPNSYWVLPGRLLAGEHPVAGAEAGWPERLERLCAAGIAFFVDLTEPGEMAVYEGLLPPTTGYLRSAIPDCEVPPEAAQMLQLQSTIRAEVARGRGVYVHCRAGIGRTGLVMGCFLGEEADDGHAGLKRLNQLWRQSARSKSWRTVPQTAEQAEYIRRWPLHRKSILSQGIDS